MSLIQKLFKTGSAAGGADEHVSMNDFLDRAAKQVEAWLAADGDWYHQLPYVRAMTPDEAKAYEIERLALWWRVIHDAQRSDLPGLRWDCRSDQHSCPACLANHDRLFRRADYAELAGLPRHLGCRCELVPVRD